MEIQNLEINIYKVQDKKALVLTIKGCILTYGYINSYIFGCIFTSVT